MQTYTVTVLGGARPCHYPQVRGRKRLAKLLKKCAEQSGIEVIVNGNRRMQTRAAPVKKPLRLRIPGEGIPGVQRPVINLTTGRYYRNLIAAGEACGGYAEGVRKVVEGLQETHRKQRFRDATYDEIKAESKRHP